MQNMQKIAILGVSCSGKTTLGRRLSKLLNMPFYDLDDYYWEPGWKLRAPALIRQDVERLTRQPAWIVCGNYSEVWDLTVYGADHIIWLDFPVALLLVRGIRRSISNIVRHQPICNGNYDSLRNLFSTNSILKWILKGRFRRREKYLRLYRQMPNLTRLQNQAQVEKLIALLPKPHHQSEN